MFSNILMISLFVDGWESESIETEVASINKGRREDRGSVIRKKH
jgi:hypothetical protein